MGSQGQRHLGRKFSLKKSKHALLAIFVKTDKTLSYKIWNDLMNNKAKLVSTAEYSPKLDITLFSNDGYINVLY